MDDSTYPFASEEAKKRAIPRMKAYAKAANRDWECLSCGTIYAGGEWVLQGCCPQCGCKIYKDVGLHINPWDRPRCTDGACCYGIPF